MKKYQKFIKGIKAMLEEKVDLEWSKDIQNQSRPAGETHVCKKYYLKNY